MNLAVRDDISTTRNSRTPEMQGSWEVVRG